MMIRRFVIGLLFAILLFPARADELDTFVDRFATGPLMAVQFDGGPLEIDGFPTFIARLREMELPCHLQTSSPPDYLLFCPGPRQDYSPEAYDLKVLLRNTEGRLVVMAAWKNGMILLGMDLIAYLHSIVRVTSTPPPDLDVFGLPGAAGSRPAAFATAPEGWPMMHFYSDGGVVADKLFGDLLISYREHGWPCLPERMEGADIQYLCVGPPGENSFSDRIVGKFMGPDLTISAIFRNGNLLLGEDLQKALADFDAGLLGVTR